MDLDSFEPDGGFGSTLFQKPAGIDRAELPESVWCQSVEDEFQFLAGLIKRIGHPEEDRVQSGPARDVDSGINVCSSYGEIRLECDLPNVSGGDGLKNWFDPVTWLSELDETEPHLFQAFTWGQINKRRLGNVV